MTTCKRITIFEGPDGGGKSTLAEAYARETNARVVHCGPFARQTSKGLARTYMEAMMPALLGYQDVVLDRCWLSEPIYGRVYRDNDRLDIARRRILERVAMRCEARVVLCLPPEETCVANWRKRHAQGHEYLDKETHLREVWKRYASGWSRGYSFTELPMMRHDYTTGVEAKVGWDPFEGYRHTVDEPTVGNWQGRVLLVGDEVTTHTDADHLDLYPFCGLGAGCSRWITSVLHEAMIRETDLLWTNANDLSAAQVVHQWREIGDRPVVALGDEADARLAEWNIPHYAAPHPQRWSRFHGGKRYPLLTILQEVLS